MTSNNIPADRLSVRKLRHSIRKRAYWAMMLTSGKPGATKEEQVAILDKQIELLTEALEKAQTTRKIVAERDFDTYKAAKDAKAAMPDVEKVPASEEAAMADLTFAELVKQLESPGGLDKLEDTFPEPKDDDQPPF